MAPDPLEHVEVTLANIADRISHHDLSRLKFLCRRASVFESRGSRGVSEYFFEECKCLPRNALEKIKDPLELFQKLHEASGLNFNDAAFLKNLWALFRAIDRKDLSGLLEPFIADVGHVDETNPLRRQRTFTFTGVAVCLLLVMLARMEYLTMHDVRDRFIHHPSSPEKDHTEIPPEALNEFREQPIIIGFTQPSQKYYHGRILHVENIRQCLDKHKRCLIKGLFGEGKSHALSAYIHETKGKYSAGVIWIREWKDIAGIASYIWSQKGQKKAVSSEAAHVYLQNFLWDNQGWLLVIQDEHLWNKKDFRRMLNLFLNLESEKNHIVITSHRIPQVLDSSFKVYEFHSGISGDCSQNMLREVFNNLVSLSAEEKQHFQNILHLTSCNQYALQHMIDFINVWNFTIEGFLHYWKDTTKDDHLKILGFGPYTDALLTEMTIIEDLKSRNPEVINFLIDHVKRGKENHDIYDCRLHKTYKGTSLHYILTELRELSLADVVINTESRYCSIKVPPLLRLVMEVTFLLRKTSNDHNGSDPE